jgi:hypothetical protein
VRRRSPSSLQSAEWPLYLRRVIRAAELECPRGHAQALKELSELALLKVPARGIFDPTSRGEHELFGVIESVARRHLGLVQARRGWHESLGHAGLELAARDEIERAALHVQAVSDTAYYYAGLAFGLTSSSLYCSR